MIPPFLFRARPGAVVARRAVWLCLAAAVFAAACGKKGPPLPPLARVPAAPANVTASRSDEQVTVRFTVPVANITGVQPADIERVDVYAWTGPNLPGSEIFKHATVIASVPVRRPPPPPEPAEEVLRLGPDAIAVGDQPELGLDLVQEAQRDAEADPVPQERHGLADDVPGCQERDSGRRGFPGEGARAPVVDVGRVERGVEEGRVAEDARGEGDAVSRRRRPARRGAP